MYINTETKEEMGKSICKYFNWKIDYLNTFLDNVYTEFKGYEMLESLSKNVFTIIKELLDEHKTTERIDKVLFFHLSRRLNTALYDNNSYNLEELLTTQNEFSKFLLKHKIKFIKENKKLKIYYNNQEISLEENNMSRMYRKYLISRLDNNGIPADFCVDGSAFYNLSPNNDYLKKLSKAPEFIDRLEQFLDYKELGKDYMENSCYMYYEYCVPIERVILDNLENLSSEEQEKNFIIYFLRRLYEYKFDSISDPLLRLKDNDNMQKEFFINKKETNIQEIIGGI